MANSKKKKYVSFVRNKEINSYTLLELLKDNIVNVIFV